MTRQEAITEETNLGIHLGYPKCCIDSFIFRNINRIGIHAVQELVHNKNGFIPCFECSCKILQGETTLDKLIQNRKHPETFPNDSLLLDDKYFESLKLRL